MSLAKEEKVKADEHRKVIDGRQHQQAAQTNLVSHSNEKRRPISGMHLATATTRVVMVHPVKGPCRLPYNAMHCMIGRMWTAGAWHATDT